MEKILYLCDGKACERCSSNCYHTNNIEHAVGFSKDEKEIGVYWQKPYLDIMDLLKPDIHKIPLTEIIEMKRTLVFNGVVSEQDLLSMDVIAIKTMYDQYIDRYPAKEKGYKND